MSTTFNVRYKPKSTREYTNSDLTVYDSAGNTALNALTVYGKSEVVDGEIVSAGEGWSTVDLGTLEWNYANDGYFGANVNINVPTVTQWEFQNGICAKYKTERMFFVINPEQGIDKTIAWNSNAIRIRDTNYTDATAFKNSINGVLLAYKLADPAQGNTIAVKTDDGTGINGTMAVFETGTPLYGIPNGAKDAATWDGVSGEVINNCGEVDLGTLTIAVAGGTTTVFTCSVPTMKQPQTADERMTNLLCPLYELSTSPIAGSMPNMSMMRVGTLVYIRNDTYTDPTAFKSAMTGVKLVYELATPTTAPLTQSENESIAGLRTFNGTTHFTNNATTDMTVNYTIKVPTIS